MLKSSGVSVDILSRLDPNKIDQTLKQWVLAPALVVLILLLGAVAHRLLLHPLRSFPGSFLSRATGLPSLYHAWKGDHHYFLYQLHEKYDALSDPDAWHHLILQTGDRVRYSPNKISFNHVAAWNDLYGFNKNTNKPEAFYWAFRVNKHAITTFDSTSKKGHRRKRRIMAKAFSNNALPGYEPLIGHCVDEMLEKFNGSRPVADNGDAEWREFNMALKLNYLMLDIMGGLCFGEAFGFVSGKGTDIVGQIHKRAFRIYMTGHEPLMKKTYLDRVLSPELFRASNDLVNYAKSFAFRRVDKYRNAEKHTAVDDGKTYQDILARLLDSRDEETNTGYSDAELLGESVLLMMAGSDTSSTALNSTLFYLIHNPSTLKKLRNELDTTFARVSAITSLAAENLHYLRACENEAMRLCPPFPANAPREVGPGGVRAVGEKLPAGIWAGIAPFTLFRNPEYFDRPHDFVPERWLEPPSTPKQKQAHAAFQPFSVGPRHCIAKQLGAREVSLVLAKLFYCFDIESVGKSGWLHRQLGRIPKEKIVLEQLDAFTSVKEGPVVRIGV